MPKKSPYSDVFIPDISFPDCMYSIIEQFKDDTAIIDHCTGESITYREIILKSRKLATALHRRGLKKGDVVGICAPSCIHYVTILLATASCGAALTTCNPEYTVEEILFQFRLAKPTMVFAHATSLERMKKVSEQSKEIKCIFPLEDSPGFESLAKLIGEAKEDDPPTVEINPKSDVLIMPYSSGTTGLPKCVMHTHSTYVATLKIMGARPSTFRSSVYYSERPMFHAGGLLVALGMLSQGVLLVTDTQSEVQRILHAIEKYKVTDTMFVPPVVIRLCNNNDLLTQYDLSSLKTITCVGAAASVGLLVDLGQKLNARIQQGYGMTECLISSAEPFLDNPESVGVITSNTQVKVIDLSTGEELEDNQNGEILVKGPQAMIGYYQNPEATAQTIDKDGWMHTGDIGRYNKDGMMFITGRIKEVIKYRTFQVPPAEIEEVVLTHPKIADVGVIGIPDPEAGEVPRALVVKKDESLTKDDVTKHVENQLADYKHLRGGVQFVDSIPKSILGKILRQDLKKIVKLN